MSVSTIKPFALFSALFMCSPSLLLIFDLEREHPEFDSTLCLVALLYFLVTIILHLGKSSRFSSSKTKNLHNIR